MYSVDDTRTPRDRVNEQFMRRLLEDDRQGNGCGCGECDMPARQMERNNFREKERAAAMPRYSEGAARCRALEGQPLAMVYSPCQIWRGIYDPEMGLRRGTIFKELDKPWEVRNMGGRGGCGCGK